MTDADRERWEAKYAAVELPAELAPDAWLTAHASGLPPGRALELACGLGHNAIWLARRGWAVDAVDISPTGLGLAEWLAEDYGVRVNWTPADLDDYVPSAQYDLVVVFRYLDRARLPGLIPPALRPGGTLIYATTRNEPGRPNGQIRNPAYLLARGELLHMFPELEVAAYEEQDVQGRPMAQLVARKPLDGE